MYVINNVRLKEYGYTCTHSMVKIIMYIIEPSCMFRTYIIHELCNKSLQTR